jgi:hypothetical protein
LNNEIKYKVINKREKSINKIKKEKSRNNNFYKIRKKIKEKYYRVDNNKK